MFNPKNPPRILFKYRHFDELGYGLKSLDEIYFSPPSEFNDPFDTGIPILYRSSGASSERILEHMLKSNLEVNDPPWDEERIRSRHLELIGQTKDLQVAQTEDLAAIMELSQRTGVFSLTEKESNILMWSHYAANHTGFCIGYRTSPLYSFLRTQADVILPRIVYSPDCPLVNPYDPNISLDWYYAPFTHKFLDWDYESEWRLILHDGAKRIIPIPENTIESVTLGLRISKENEAVLIEKIRARKLRPNVFRIIRKFSSFELAFAPVSIE